MPHLLLEIYLSLWLCIQVLNIISLSCPLKLLTNGIIWWAHSTSCMCPYFLVSKPEFQQSLHWMQYLYGCIYVLWYQLYSHWNSNSHSAFSLLLPEELEWFRVGAIPCTLYIFQNVPPYLFKSEGSYSIGLRQIKVGFIHPLAKSSHNLSQMHKPICWYTTN